MIKVKVFAKVNLSLEINGIENGFHMLDSVVASADIVDVISLAKSETDKVEITPCYDSVKEKIYSLISFMRAKYEFECVNINIEKNIPLGGGLGGSSAPIAGVIRGIDQLFSLNLSKQEMVDIANNFGSDTAFMLYGGCGKIIERIRVCNEFEMQGRNIVIATKGFCDTKEVFALFDNSPVTLQYINNEVLINALKNNESIDGLCVNRLIYSAIQINPAIEQGLKVLGGNASMSGSGSSVFAFAVTERAKDKLKQNGFRVFDCKIGNYKTQVIKE